MESRQDDFNLKIAAIATVGLSATGGLETFATELLHGLAARGHQVDVWIPAGERVRNRRFYRTMPGATHSLPPKSAWQMAHFSFPLATYMRFQQRIHRYDVWQVFGAHPTAQIASALHGLVPTVMYGFGADIQKDEALGYGLRLDPDVEQTIIQNISKMTHLVASSSTISDCYRELEAPESQITHIPLSVDLQRFMTGTDREQVRDHWKIPAGHQMILTVGRNHPKKRYDLIPRVATLLKERGVKFTWLVVGRDTDELGSQINLADLEDEVRPIPPIHVDQSAGASRGGIAPELADLYQVADCFVLPSDLETFGKVLVEAMAAGTAVVTTDAPGCRDVVQDEQNGLSVKTGDVEGMAQAINRLYSDPELSKSLVAHGLEFAAAHDIGVIAQRYEEIYQNLV